MTFSKNDIAEYISSSDSVKKMYRLAMDSGFWPDFPDYQVEKFSSYLDAVEIINLQSIDNFIFENASSISAFFAEIFAHRKKGWPWRLNSVFLCELVLILKYPQIFHRDYLIENNWNAESAEIVSSAAIKLSPAKA